MEKDQLACVYAALILADDDVAVTDEKLKTVLKAAKVDVQPYWPALFAKALGAANIKELITNISSGVGSAPAAAAAPAEAAAADTKGKNKKEEKKEESDEEEGDFGFDIFG